MLEEHIRKAVQEKGLALMGHIVCGYPSFEANWEILEEMESAGVDVVEMQFPFSEPIADGPLFLAANQESLSKGTILDGCFDLMQKASGQFSFKVLMMGYYNTVFKKGEEEFCRRMQDTGGSGLIIPDLPIDEADTLLDYCSQYNLSFIRLVAPTNKPERIKQILSNASGFIYAVARKGVTGAQTEFSEDMERYLSLLRENSQVPIAVGFGISQKSDLDYLRGKVEMAVVGTALLKTYLADGRKGLNQFFQQLRNS
jgi:tryptophan synthase alpha chain